MKAAMHRSISILYLAGLCVLSVTTPGCSAGKLVTGEVNVTDQAITGTVPKKAPPVIYILDFNLEYEHLQTGGIVKRQGLLRRVPAPLKGDDPQKKAQHIVHGMTDALVAAFTEKGIAVQQLDAGATVPREGWLVSGEFLEIDEGNRAVRATIGFGKGATAMDVAVSVSDLADRPNEPFMVFGTAKTAGKMPGAVVTMNPFVAAGKFVMEKNASDKDIKKTADQIVTQIIQQGGLQPTSAPVVQK